MKMQAPEHSAKRMRIAVFGQIAGPIGGQSRLTQAFRDGTAARTVFFEFWGHKAGLGPLRMLRQILQCAGLAITGSVDVAYIAMSRSNFGMFRDLLVLMPFILAGVPVVAHVHGAEFEEFFLRTPRFGRAKAFYLRKVTRFIFVNEVFVPTDPALAARSTFVRNPIPHFAVAALARGDHDATACRPAGQDRRCFGFISTFAREKGIELFLDAAQRFADRAAFVVAGGPSIENPGYGNEILKRMAGMPEVEYLGYLSDPTPFYDRCDFMVFPTNFASETSSLVVIESLATRTHPIVRRHNRLTDIFGTAPASWFDDGDGLMRQIEAALALPESELQARYEEGRAWVKATFPTEADWVRRVEAIVREAAATRGRGAS